MSMREILPLLVCLECTVFLHQVQASSEERPSLEIAESQKALKVVGAASTARAPAEAQAVSSSFKVFATLLMAFEPIAALSLSTPGLSFPVGIQSCSRPVHHAPQMSASSQLSHTPIDKPLWASLNKAFKRSIGYNATVAKEMKGVLPSTREEALAVIARGAGSEILPGVFFLGWRTRDTFGAAGYLIVRDNGASNVLIDCAKPADELIEAVRLLGGAKYAIFTHTDDLAGHGEWKNKLQCERIIHEAEVRTGWNADWERTDEIEVQLGQKASAHAWAQSSRGPWILAGGDDIIIHHTPGHSVGHVTIQLLDQQHDRMVLFTGDHFCLSNKHKILGYTSRFSHSYRQQIQSVRYLKDLDFDWILPGHGRPYQFIKQDVHARRVLIENAASNMESGLLD